MRVIFEGPVFESEAEDHRICLDIRFDVFLIISMFLCSENLIYTTQFLYDRKFIRQKIYTVFPKPYKFSASINFL